MTTNEPGMGTITREAALAAIASGLRPLPSLRRTNLRGADLSEAVIVIGGIRMVPAP